MNISATSKTDYNLIKVWFENWGRLVSSLDFSSAAKMFEKDVVAFGTWMDTVEGVENLIESQWKSIWPTIKDFRFLTETLQIHISPDRLFAVAILVWDSTGFEKNGSSYKRPGRATVSLRRKNLNSSWKGTHTHLSLFRGVKQKSYGPPS